MESSWPHLSADSSDFRTVAALILVAIALTAAIMVLTHLLGPKRSGPVKDSPYESGMDPFTDARRRFQVRFYLIPVMYLLFAVDLIFLYPWARLLSRLHPVTPADEPWAQAMASAGYTTGYMLVAAGVFVALLLVGFVYEWRRGAFRWN